MPDPLVAQFMPDPIIAQFMPDPLLSAPVGLPVVQPGSIKVGHPVSPGVVAADDKSDIEQKIKKEIPQLCINLDNPQSNLKLLELVNGLIEIQKHKEAQQISQPVISPATSSPATSVTTTASGHLQVNSKTPEPIFSESLPTTAHGSFLGKTVMLVSSPVSHTTCTDPLTTVNVSNLQTSVAPSTNTSVDDGAPSASLKNAVHVQQRSLSHQQVSSNTTAPLVCLTSGVQVGANPTTIIPHQFPTNNISSSDHNKLNSQASLPIISSSVQQAATSSAAACESPSHALLPITATKTQPNFQTLPITLNYAPSTTGLNLHPQLDNTYSPSSALIIQKTPVEMSLNPASKIVSHPYQLLISSATDTPTVLTDLPLFSGAQREQVDKFQSITSTPVSFTALDTLSSKAAGSSSSSCKDRSLQHSTLINSISNVNMSQSQSRRAIHLSKNSLEPGHQNSSQLNVASVVHSTQTPQVFESQVSASLLQSPLSFLSKQPLSSSLASSPQGNVTSSIKTPSSCSSGSFVFDALADSPIKDVNLQVSPQTSAKSSLLCEMLLSSSSLPLSGISSDHHSSLPFSGMSYSNHYTNPAAIVSLESHCSFAPKPIPISNANLRLASLESCPPSPSNNLTAERHLGTSNTQITSHIDVSTHQPSLKVSRVQRTRDPPQVGIVNPYISSSLKPESSSNQSTLLSEHLALASPTMATYIRDNTNQDTEVRRLDQFISLSTSLDQSIVQHLVSNEPIYTGQLSTQTNHVNQRTPLDDLNQANAVTVVSQYDNSSTSVTNSEKTHAWPCFTQLRHGLPSGQNNPVVSNILGSSYPSHLVSSAPSNSCLTQTVSSVVSSASSSSPLIVQAIICQDTGQIKLLPLLITREQCPSTSVFASDTHSTNQIVLSRPNPGSSSASVLATAGPTVLPSSQTQTVLLQKNDLPNLASTFALGDNSNLPLVLNSGPMKNSLLPQTKTSLGSSNIGQAIYLSGHSDNQNLFSQQDNGSTNVIFNLGQDLQAVQNAGQSSGQTLNHFKLDNLSNLNSSGGHSILPMASFISSLSQQLTNSVDTISASSVNNPGGQHRPLRPKPESSLQQMVRSKSDVQQMVRSESSVQQVVRPESSEQLAVRPDSGAPNVINPKPGQNCTFLLVPDQPNYPTYQIALCPNTKLDSQIGVSVPDTGGLQQPGICREQTTSLLPIQMQGLGPGLNSCIPQWATPVSPTETISQHSVVVSVQSLSNTSGPSSAVYITAPPSQPDLSQTGLPSTFDPQRSPVTMSASQTAGVAQPKSYLSITPEAKQSHLSEKSVSSTHNSHHIPHSNMYIKGNSEALSLPGLNQEPPNGRAIKNTQIGPSTSSKVSVLLNTPPNLTNKPGEITFLRNKEVIDLTEDSPPLTPASKHDATISLKRNSHHLEPTRLSENLLSPNPQTGQSQMNETLLNYTENTPNDPMSSQLFNIRQSVQNSAQEMPNVKILVIAQPGSTPMTFSTTRLATQELTDTSSEVFLSLSPQVSQRSQGAQDQIYLAPPNIIGHKAGRNMVSHTNDQMSLPAGHLSAPPVSSAPVELITPGHLSSQASRPEMEWVNRLAVTSSPSSKLFQAPSSSPQSTSHSSCNPISPLSSYVVFTRATNTPMDAVGPPNITVMSPSRISARLRSESSFLPTAAMVNLSTPPLITNTKSGVSKQAVTANTKLYVLPPVTTSTLSYVSIPPVTTSTLSYVSIPPVTTSTLSYVRTPPVTTSTLSYVSITPVTTSTLSSLKTPSLTPKPSTQNTAQQVFHPTLINNLPCPKTCVTLSQSTDRTSSLSVIPVCESYTVPQALSITRAPKPRKKPSTVLELLKNKESMQNTSLQASTTSVSTMPLLQPVGQMASSVIFQGNLVNQSASVQPTALTVQLKNAPHGSAGHSSEKNLSLKGTSSVLVLHAEKPQLRDTCDSQQHHAYTANIPPGRLQMVTQSPAQQQVSIGHNASPGTSVLPKLVSLSALPNSGAQKIAVPKTPVLIAEPKLKFVTQPLGSSPLTFLPKSTAPGLTIVSCKPSSESAPKSMTEGKTSSEERVMLSKLDTKQTDLSSEMLQFVKSKQIASTNFSVPASSGTGTSLKLKLPSQQLNSENRHLSENREQKNLLSSISVGQLDRSVLSSSVASESIRRQNIQIPEQMQIQKLFLRPGQPVLTSSNPILSNILFSHSVSEPSQVYHSTSAPRGSSGNPSELNNPEMTDQRDLIQANLSPPQTSSQNDTAVRPFKTMGSAPVSVTQLQDETPRNSFDQPSKYFTLSKTGPSTIFTSEQLSDLQHPSSEAIITKHSSGGQFIVSSDSDHAKNESFKNGRIGKIIDDIYNRGDDIDEASVVISSQFFTRNPQTSSINTAFQVANKQTTIAQNTAVISRSECVETTVCGRHGSFLLLFRAPPEFSPAQWAPDVSAQVEIAQTLCRCKPNGAYGGYQCLESFSTLKKASVKNRKADN
ncbi:hypothetical protein Btru_051412 [Bulinus truncatus]|nr:hypothetical protein Btru_051412 [Bulinus truncatus]